MPFVIKKYHLDKPIKAFLFLINELSITQRDSQRLISKGRLLIDSVAMTNSAQIIVGDIELIVFEPSTNNLLPLHVEDDFVVFDKPSGVLIHPQNRNTQYSLVDELKYQFGNDANIAHRIDQETSGLVLCARNKDSEIRLKTLFENRDIKKNYLAFVHGKVSNELFIDEPLLRKEDLSAIVRMVVKVDSRGKPSQTNIKPLEYFPDLDMTLVEASPLTGRQHQIRVHLFHVKHPIVGDPIYGQSDVDTVRFLDKLISDEERIHLSGFNRLLLHASELQFNFNDKIHHIKSDKEFIENTIYSLRKKVIHT